MTIQSLVPLGWDDHFTNQLETINSAAGFPARITAVHKNCFTAHDGVAEQTVTAAGRLIYGNHNLYPVTGDFVLVQETMITQVVPRKNALFRGAAGVRDRQRPSPVKAQVLAANLDTVFVVCGLDRDYNLRRVERYLTLIYNCGLSPVIVLTKADLHPDPDGCLAEVEAVAFGVPVYVMSLRDDSSLGALEVFLGPGRTIAMIGSSGAGKSTLVNRLAGQDIQAVGCVSEYDGKGRHTTTSRSLITMPQGGMVVDNPGIREIAFWEDDRGMDSTFGDIETLARSCRFSDCTHTHEPGCRVVEGLGSGKVAPQRLESYRKMKNELDYLAQRQQKSADRVEKERWKGVAMKIKAMKTKKGTG